MKNENLLTIAIPTRNRGNFLKETLESLVSQPLFDTINIVVCNNNSDDNTHEVLSKYETIPNILIYHNSETLSIDENMIKVAKFVTSKYFLWLGDDDLIKKSKLKEILGILNNGNYDLILLNAEYISVDFATSYGTTLSLNENITYTVPKDFFKQHCFNTPFGSVILNTKGFTKSLKNIQKYMGTSHAYGSIFYDYLSRKYNNEHIVNIFVVADDYIFLRKVKKTWANDAAKIIFNEIPKWFTTFDSHYKKEAKKMFEIYLNREFTFKRLLFYRFFTGISLSNAKVNLEYVTTFKKIKYLIVCLLPKIDLIKKIIDKRLKNEL